MHPRSREQLKEWLQRHQWKAEENDLRDPAWIEKYVSEMIAKAMPAAAASAVRAATSAGSGKEIGWKESKHYLEMTLELSPATRLSDLQLYVREDYVCICGLANSRKKKIKLPALVLPRYCRAFIEGADLHIRLRKRPLRRNVCQVEIEAGKQPEK